jgi:DNA-binding CsgD family transcriptional regulator
MYLSDPERTTPIDPETLSATFELTPKEAAVAVALANGLSVEEVSKTNGTTLNTIRTQLKAIFRKTGTRRQTELVRLLLSGPFMA